LGIEVDPNHGLYAFFRKTGNAVGVENARYETIEPASSAKSGSGRSWNAAELRLKSFKDLHTLWYICLRERNLLATQVEEARRMGIDNQNALAVIPRVYQVRKTMARIKYVLNERRLAYEGALKLHEQEAQEAAAAAATKVAAPSKGRATRGRIRARRISRSSIKMAPATTPTSNTDVEATDVAQTPATEVLEEPSATQQTAENVPQGTTQASKLAAESLFSRRK
jgi:large subunit ribosomal protein L47